VKPWVWIVLGVGGAVAVWWTMRQTKHEAWLAQPALAPPVEDADRVAAAERIAAVRETMPTSGPTPTEQRYADLLHGAIPMTGVRGWR